MVLMLATAIAAGAESVSRHYGSTDAGIELVLETDASEGPEYLRVQRDAGSGYDILIPPLQLHAEDDEKSGRVLAGRGLVAGNVELIRLRIDGDSGALQWLDPERLDFPDAAPLPMSGRHMHLTDAARLADAKARFATADAALNTLYADVRAHLSADDFGELRANQRRWLRYRDHFVTDGDDAERNGPGSVPFLREQARRTHARIGFLRAVRMPRAADDGISGRYDDGLGRTLDIALVPGEQRRILVTLHTDTAELHAPGTAGPLTLAGSAGATHGQWEADAGDIRASRASYEPAQILFERVGEHAHAILVSEAAGEMFGGRYQRRSDLTPAIAPMRELLRRLASAAFDDTEEGLSDEDALALALTGKSAFFTAQQPGPDFLRLRYGVGQVELRRYAHRNGGAVLALATTNVRVRTFALWQFPSGAGAPTRIEPGHAPLPALNAGDFFPDDCDAPAIEPWRYEYALDEHVADIRIRIRPDADAPLPDIGIDLIWDGFGFGAVQTAL